MKNDGKAGCGCLMVLLVLVMIVVGIMIHPFTLKLIAKQFKYEDKVFPADALFVPRFQEDKNGELYIEAFRQYQAGNGKIILIEDDKILGTSIMDAIVKLARARSIKESALRTIEGEGEARTRTGIAKEKITVLGLKKVIVLVPEYASRRFHLLYDSSGEQGKALYMIKPVTVPYFKMDRWWKETASQALLVKEVGHISASYLEKIKYR
jgi:hypothetical protein